MSTKKASNINKDLCKKKSKFIGEWFDHDWRYHVNKVERTCARCGESEIFFGSDGQLEDWRPKFVEGKEEL